MVLYHIVLFRIRDGVPQQDVATLENELRALTRSIPFIRHLAVGPHDNLIYEGYKPRNQGYSHALVVTLDSGSDLKKYANHPSHLACVEKHIKPLSDAVLAVDFMDSASENGYASSEPCKIEWSACCCWRRTASLFLTPAGFMTLGAALAFGATFVLRLRSSNTPSSQS